ncbi:putative phage tail protein [Paenibacillus popilliae]|uniref:DUF2313 domain-containing protein n=1 Tax=Paenibacillus popilliae ATCC 14706 TaxID=1212764 RepID=M9LBQ4_PAEPP|nr:putative phage tail protein [Paenibacillus popilliae]GAC43342.1 hypothetical protein PPOP_2709 [Paenibacillus popilliae ATCC 14706]
MLKNYWPDYLQEIREFEALAAAQQPEFDRALSLISTMAQDFSVFTLTESGIQRWERILGIDGKQADDMDSRRFRIISRVIERIPITKRTLYTQLETLCGKGGFTLEINSGGYVLSVKLALTSKSAFSDVVALLGRQAPANLICEVTIMYNKHNVLGQFTHAQMSKRTHYELRNEVI